MKKCDTFHLFQTYSSFYLFKHINMKSLQMWRSFKLSWTSAVHFYSQPTLLLYKPDNSCEKHLNTQT